MEKYTQFRDKATGISPFMPNSSLNNPLQSPAFIPLKIVLFVARLLGSVPFIVLSFVPGLSGVAIRAVLLIWGMMKYEISVQSVKRLKDIGGFLPAKNEVYFVNFTSPLDYLFCWIVSRDSFVVLIPDHTGNLKQFGLLDFVKRALNGDDTTGGSAFDPQDLKNKIVYIFPEASTSNGKAITPFTITEKQWSTFYKSLPSSYKIKTLTIKLTPSYLTTPLALSPAEYFFKLLSSPQFTAKMRINFSEDETLLKVKNSFTYNGKFKLIEGVGLREKQEFVRVYKGRR